MGHETLVGVGAALVGVVTLVPVAVLWVWWLVAGRRRRPERVVATTGRRSWPAGRERPTGDDTRS